MRTGIGRSVLLAACAVALLGAPAAASAFSPDQEAQNFAKIFERERYVTATPEFLSLLAAQTANGPVEGVERLANDPERLPANVCGMRMFECAGDVRFYDWPEHGDGIRESVVFTARSGATLSGHVWATRSGPAQRPAIVITTGSVQAPEELYWGQAATLAKHGYVVITYDVQGQGLSDTLGEGADQTEGVPSQAGEPFFDGTEDALDFVLSGPSNPYEPRPSCTTGTSHAPKQDRRVAEGHNDAYNPLIDLVDSSRIGIAGHSLGASAVSFVGQEDPRVDATVAWDNLSAPSGGGFGNTPDCASAPETRDPATPITKPAMGISNDYGIAPEPFTSDPDPQGKNAAFDAYRDAGVDSAEMVIRGGCHEESAFVPGSFTGAYPLGCGSLRGGDLIAWYSTAWFDKYVKGDASADTRLLSDRWRDDARGKAVDLAGDPNLFSFYYRSVIDIGLSGGGRAACDNLRDGCPVLGPDGEPSDYSFLADANGTSAPPSETPGTSETPGAPQQSGTPGAPANARSPSSGSAKRAKCKRTKRKRSGRKRRGCKKTR